MGASSITAFWRPLRALAAFLVAAALLGAAAAVAASACLLWLLLYRAGGLAFHLSVAAARVLGSIVLATLILASALRAALRIRWA